MIRVPMICNHACLEGLLHACTSFMKISTVRHNMHCIGTQTFGNASNAALHFHDHESTFSNSRAPVDFRSSALQQRQLRGWFLFPIGTRHSNLSTAIDKCRNFSRILQLDTTAKNHYNFMHAWKSTANVCISLLKSGMGHSKIEEIKDFNGNF